jgi:insulysin
MSHLHKPLLDERLYEQFQLPNGIYVTTVNDKRSEKSSCSLAVRIGAAADDLPGLAHITEHAVFLGSEKYPVENEYKKYLNKNGGGSNGGTSMEQTVYKFYVNALSFDQGVDIFSQFFKCPLLNAEAISREIHAVDSEDSKNRILEGRRFFAGVESSSE